MLLLTQTLEEIINILNAPIFFHITFVHLHQVYVSVRIIINNSKSNLLCGQLFNTVQVWFDPTSYTVYESDGNVTLTVKNNGGPREGCVEFYTVNGTAASKPEG